MDKKLLLLITMMVSTLLADEWSDFMMTYRKLRGILKKDPCYDQEAENANQLYFIWLNTREQAGGIDSFASQYAQLIGGYFAFFSPHEQNSHIYWARFFYRALSKDNYAKTVEVARNYDIDLLDFEQRLEESGVIWATREEERRLSINSNQNNQN